MFSADLGVNQVVSSPPATDPPFQKVALLLHGDGTNGAQNNTFLDSSTNNFTITRTGNVAQGTFSPFSLADGQWSNYFDGTSAYETVATNSVFTYGTNDFTIECLFYLGKTGAQQQLIDQRNSGTATAIIPTLYVSSSNVLTYYVNGSAVITGSTTLSVGSWYHVAVSRSSTSTKMFLNGTQEGSTYSDSNNYAASRVVLGAQASSAANYLQGYLSNVRLVNGTAVYTANFTPPTSALTAITNTSLLTCQSNRFIDNSSNAFGITPSGTPKVTAFSPFAPSSAYSASTNGGSGYFDGSGDYLSAAYGSGFNLSTNNFTIEGWFYFSSVASGKQILTGYSNVSTNRNFAFYMPSSGTVSYYLSSNGTSWDIASGVTIGTVTTNTWYHIALVRNGSTFTPYINGISGTTATSSSAIYNGSSPIIIGADPSGSSNYTGYASNLRLVNGTAIYTANFTPPTAPLTAVANTQLLLNCTNAGIIDNAGKNDIETVGNAQISTSVKKYGTGSMAFDGNGDYLALPTNQDFAFGTGDFTVECWAYAAAGGSNNGIWMLSNAYGVNTSYQLAIVFNTPNIFIAAKGVGGTTSGVTITTSTWYHLALVRSGTTTKLYVNGVARYTVTADSTNYTNTYLTVGGYYSTGYLLNGYIDDLRITKGQALYTANFTPPTQAFPNV